MKMITRILCAAAATCMFAAPASAIPVTWYLYDANFSSAGSASGSFDYDADLNQYSSIDITTTPGGSLPGAHYTIVNPTSPGNASIMIVLDGPPSLDTYEFALGFAVPLTNLGGTVAVVPYPSGFTVEGICTTAVCGGIDAPFRFLTSAAYVTTTRISEVPEPAALGLFGFGLAGLAYLRRRRAAA